MTHDLLSRERRYPSAQVYTVCGAINHRCHLNDEREPVLTDTLAAVAANVPRARDSRAVLAGTGGRASTARLELAARVKALPVVGQAGETRDRASLHAVGAKRDIAGLVVALPAVVAALARLARRRGGDRGRGVGIAAPGARVPAPAGATLRGRRVGVVGNAAALAGVPVPVRRAVRALGGLGRVRLTTVRQAAALRAPAKRDEAPISVGRERMNDEATYYHSLDLQSDELLVVAGGALVVVMW